MPIFWEKASKYTIVNYKVSSQNRMQNLRYISSSMERFSFLLAPATVTLTERCVWANGGCGWKETQLSVEIGERWIMNDGCWRDSECEPTVIVVRRRRGRRRRSRGMNRTRRWGREGWKILVLFALFLFLFFNHSLQR